LLQQLDFYQQLWLFDKEKVGKGGADAVWRRISFSRNAPAERGLQRSTGRSDLCR
jgi:hypothetical protein